MTSFIALLLTTQLSMEVMGTLFCICGDELSLVRKRMPDELPAGQTVHA